MLLLRLAISQMLFNTIFQFSTLFINTYLYKTGGGEQSAAVYNLVMYASWIFFFYLGTRSTARNTAYGLRLGGLFSVAMMAVLLSGHGNPYILGLAMGAAGGFFWPSQLTVYRKLSDQGEGGGTFAKVSLLTTLVSIFNPMLFGHIVQGSGYITGFIIILVLALGVIGVSYWLPSLRTDPVHVTGRTFAHPGFLGAATMNGLFTSFISIANGLMIYMSGQGEAHVGTFNTFFGVIGLAVNALIGYIVPARYNRLMMLTASLVFLASSGLFYMHGGLSTRVIAFNFLVAAATPMFSSPFVGSNFAYINRHFANAAEGLFMRECGFTIGRILFFSYMAFFGLQAGTPGFRAFIAVAPLFPLLITFIVGRRGPAPRAVIVEARKPTA